MVERKFTVINKSGERLVCIEVLPEANPDTPLPVVVMCHGFAYFKEEDGKFPGLADRLAKQGYASYYFDFSGCGDSQGDYEQSSLTKLVDDLKSIIAEVTSYKYIDADRLSLVGHSFGSAVIVAAQIPKVKRLVLGGSAANMYPTLKEHMHEFNEQGVSSRTNSRGKRITIGPQFWKDLKSYNLPELITFYNCPILFVHGDQDDIVPIENGQALMSTAKHAQMVVLKGSDHSFEPGLQDALNSMANFFKS